MIRKCIIAAFLTIASVSSVAAQEFFDTEKPDRMFDFGARVGVNTSNRTLNGNFANIWNVNSWGTGFDAGVVVDINFRNYISLQPGFFYESRSGAFAYQSTDLSGHNPGGVITQLGKGREYLFTIPIVGSIHFNILDELRWNVDFGPYLQFKLRSTFDNKFEYPIATVVSGLEYVNNPRTSKFDIGLKMGTGIDIFEHYYVGVHYLAGLCHAWNPGMLGGHNKEWMFTIGYNF